MRRTEREALALGLLHGPAELVPISSSGHAAALPWLLRWEVAGWDGARRKELEVALHAGTAAALALILGHRADFVRRHRHRADLVRRHRRRADLVRRHRHRADLGRRHRHRADLGRRHRHRANLGRRHKRPGARVALLAGALLPPAAAGLALERRIEARLGTPVTLAAGLLAGGAALVLADRAPGDRRAPDAGLVDGLWLGLAQASALVPGVSRNGATLAAARARGFSRPAASRLSWEVALPVLAGATALKAARVARSATADRTALVAPAGRVRRATAADRTASVATAGRVARPATADGATRLRPLAVAAGAAFGSTLATARAIGLERRAPLWPWAVWRAGLAAAILAVRHNRRR